MTKNIETTLHEIEYLLAKKKIEENCKPLAHEYISLLSQLKTQYDSLALQYANEGDNCLLCQAMLDSVNITTEICEIEPNRIKEQELHNVINDFVEVTSNCYDLNLCRSAFIAIGKLHNYLGEYSLAEEYIQKAFDDYDYSKTTFQIYMKVLDIQYKFQKILSLMELYLGMGEGYHDKCSIEDFHVPNIMSSSYAEAYRSLFD